MLFKTSAKLKEYAGLSGEINLDSVRKTVRSVEEDYLLPSLGPELFNDLTDAYEQASTEEELSDKLKALLDRCRCVVGPYFVYQWAPRAEVQLSDGGLHRQETENNKSSYQYQATNFREAALAEGERELEKLYAFLEKNVEAYPAWATSAAFAQYRSLFFHTATEFAQCFASASPYRVFYAIRSKMQDIEENCIRPALGDALFDYLKEVDQSGVTSFSVREKGLMLRVKKAIAYQSVAAAIPFLNIRIDAAGLTVASTAPFTSNDRDNSRGGAGDNAISALMKSCNSSGQIWMHNILKYLADHRTDFAEWLPIVVAPVLVQLPGNEMYGGSFGLF